MDYDTLNRIEELAASKLDLQQVIDTTNLTDMPAVVLPDKVKLQSLEHLLGQPRRFKGRFTTNSRDAFLDYCEANVGVQTSIFIDPQTMTATAIFDLGNPGEPGWGQHHAILALDDKPAYLALQSFCAAPRSQEDLIAFFEDWRHCIKPLDKDGKEMPFLEALAAIRAIDIKTARSAGSQIQDFSRKRSVLENIDVTSTSRLPAAIEFTCAPHQDFTERTFRCRLWAKTSGEDLAFGVQPVALDELKEQIAEEFRASLAEAKQLEDANGTYIGTFKL